MADIWEAYQFLNKAKKLNLSNEEIEKFERAFKVQWAEAHDKKIGDPDSWEFFGELKPKTGK